MLAYTRGGKHEYLDQKNNAFVTKIDLLPIKLTR